jgi:hypothetical protein
LTVPGGIPFTGPRQTLREPPTQVISHVGSRPSDRPREPPRDITTIWGGNRPSDRPREPPRDITTVWGGSRPSDRPRDQPWDRPWDRPREPTTIWGNRPTETKYFPEPRFPTVTSWRPYPSQQGQRPPWDDNPYRPGWANPYLGDRKPEWKPYGNSWDRPGGGPPPWGDRPRHGDRPWATTTLIGIIPTTPAWANPDWYRPDWRPPRDWVPPRGWRPAPGWIPPPDWIPPTWWVPPPPPQTIYQTWDPYYYYDDPSYSPPWAYLPAPILPPITLSFGLPPLPNLGCQYYPVTYPSQIITDATYTDTITQPPIDAMITVYVDGYNGETSTDWGPLETVYEVYVYETTAQVDVVSTTTSCGLSWFKRSAAVE